MSDKFKVQGRVKKIFEKKWPQGNTTYSITLEDHTPFFRTPRGPKKGSDGERFPGIIEVGNMISFSACNIDEKSAQIDGRVILVEESAATPAAAPAGSTGSTGGSFESRDLSIQYQSSRKDALALVDLLVKAGALPLPAKAADKCSALEAAVDHYTAAYYTDVGTRGAVARANGEGDETAKASAEDDNE